MTNNPERNPQPELVPPDWTTLEPLLDRLLDAPPAARPSLLDQLSEGDDDRRSALARMLSACERDLPLLDAPAAERFDALAAEAEPNEPLLPEVLGDRYQIVREIGRGGMARVYLAHDIKHSRDVAIKVIRPELSASLGHERFLREIDIAARLRHPNIVPLYDSGEVDGVLYFVMPFENGPSLRDRLRKDGAFPIGDALNILRDVARALAYAHENGFVHRDVKPDNVMLSSGAAVVTDFGIAKAVSAALTSGGGDGVLTLTGAGIGTPAYMAPEQAMGDPATNHRADIYSFGCVAYELFAGHPPFVEPSAHLLVAAHMTRTPTPLAEVRADVPENIAAIVASCLQKSPDDRMQNVSEILAMLDGTAQPPAATRVTSSAPSSNAVTTGMSAARGNVGRRTGAIIAILLLLLAGVGYFISRPGPPPPAQPITLSVLPFGNTAADTSMEFVVQSLGDEVAASLIHIPGLVVKSRAGARRYAGQLSPDVTEAGARLRADYIVTGVVRQENQQWLLAVELSRAADGASLWTKNVHLKPDEQAGAVDLIARSLLSELRSEFPGTIGSATAAATSGATTNSEAYRLYLRGQTGLNRRGLSVKESADMFRQAIREDSMFARAWSGLSMALALFPYFQNVPPGEINSELVRSAKRALALSPDLAQPHIALGFAYVYRAQWDSAEAEFRLAVDQDPRNVEAHVQYGMLFRNRGQHKEALQQLRLARTEDPASALVLSQIAYEFYLNGQQDSALAESRRALENDSLNFTSLALGAEILLYNGRAAQAAPLVRRLLPRIPHRPYLLAKAGDQDEVRREIAALTPESSREFQASKWLAFAYLGLGDTTKAFDAFEQAAAKNEFRPMYPSFDSPLFAPLLRYPRFADLVRRQGFREQVDAFNARR